MAEGFDYFEMGELPNEYREYDNMDKKALDNEYEKLTNERYDLLCNDNPTRLEEVKNRLRRIEHMRGDGIVETTLTRDDSDKTVTITTKDGTSLDVPKINSNTHTNYDDVEEANFNLAFEKQVEIRRRLDKLGELNKYVVENQIKRTKLIRKKVKRTYKKSLGRDQISKEIVDRSLVSEPGSVFFKAKNEDGTYQTPKLILKPNNNGELIYSKDKRSSKAIEQFKELIKRLPEDETIEPTETIEYDETLMIDVTPNTDDITGLSHDENERTREVMEGDMVTIKMYEEEVEDVMKETKDELNNVLKQLNLLRHEFDIRIKDNRNFTYEQKEDSIKKINELREKLTLLEERIGGLTEVEDRLDTQSTNLQVRERQEEDISRLQRFKKWAKENIAVVSVLAISIAGIITTIVVGARTAIVKGAQATSKFGKALANLGKKLLPVLGPLLNIIAQAISWGAKGLAWLASNLWVLAIAAAWFIYDYYKQRRR